MSESTRNTRRETNGTWEQEATTDPDATQVIREPEATRPLDPWDQESSLEPERPTDPRSGYLQDNRTLPLAPAVATGAPDVGHARRSPGRGETEAPRPGTGRTENRGRTAPDRPERPEASWDGYAPAGAAAGGAAPGSTAMGDQPDPGLAERVRGIVLAEQKAEFSRVQLIPGLIGWLVALVLTGFLTTLAAALLPRLGLPKAPRAVADAVSGLAQHPSTGMAWTVAYGVVYFLAYLAGGYAAGRAARFGGGKQGIAVFLWFLVITAVASVVGMILGIAGGYGTMPVMAQDYGGSSVGWTGLTLVGVAIISLLAGSLGGLWGIRYHRRADRVGFGAL